MPSELGPLDEGGIEDDDRPCRDPHLLGDRSVVLEAAQPHRHGRRSEGERGEHVLAQTGQVVGVCEVAPCRIRIAVSDRTGLVEEVGVDRHDVLPEGAQGRGQVGGEPRLADPAAAVDAEPERPGPITRLEPLGDLGEQVDTLVRRHPRLLVNDSSPLPVGEGARVMVPVSGPTPDQCDFGTPVSETPRNSWPSAAGWPSSSPRCSSACSTSSAVGLSTTPSQ